jgi:predicted nucleotide-binding protein (sugar kinase/HSP70/actin superfamily)
LADKVDYVFVPRIVGITRDATLCPKFLGLPDMIKSSVRGIPPLLTPRFDIRDGRFAPVKAWIKVARVLGAGYRSALQAYRKSVKVRQYYEELLTSRMLPDEAMLLLDRWTASLKGEKQRLSDVKSSVASARASSVDTAESQGSNIRLAVVGYPYMIYDGFVNCGLLDTLKRFGASILTPEMVPAKVRQAQAAKQPKYLFWHYSNQVIRAVYYFFQENMVDGVIHLTAFACGPDAMVDKLLELDCQKHSRIPYLSLCLDEHTGRAGIITRLEAFTDMLVRKRGGKR